MIVSREHHRDKKNPTAHRHLQSATERMAAGSTIGQARAKTDQDAAEYANHPTLALLVPNRLTHISGNALR